MTDDQLIESLRARTYPGDCEAAAFRIEELRARVAELEALPGNVLARRVETPSSHWSADGKPDPHGKTYDCERAGLHMGNLTDDELANGAFLNYDQPLNVAGILAGTYHSPIAWMTAVKDRIRWLSRSLEKAAKAEQERDALALRVSELTCQIDRAEEAMVERDALAAELKALRDQEPVNTRLLERISDAMQSYERHGAICMFEGSPMIYASTLTEIADIAAIAESAIESSPKPVSPDLLESARAVVARWDAPTWKDFPATAEYIGRLRAAIAQADLDGALTAEEWVVKNVSGSPGLVRAMVIRAEVAESAIETPAKISPCAGHAVQQEAGYEND